MIRRGTVMRVGCRMCAVLICILYMERVSVSGKVFISQTHSEVSLHEKCW